MNVDDKIYNYNRKVEFIDFYVGQGETDSAKKSRADAALSVFRHIGPIEKRYDKDFCEFSLDSQEMDDVYLLWFNKLCAGSQRRLVAVMKSYVLWCYENQFISAREYKSHGIMIKRASLKKNVFETCSEITVKQIEAIQKKNKYESDFIFEDEESFMNYVQNLFYSGRYTMTATVVVLLYYQFSFDSIRNLLKTDVNKESHSVKTVVINNDYAFSVIWNSVISTGYETIVNLGDKQISRMVEYVDSPYLVRSIVKGDMVQDQISVHYAHKLISIEKEASAFLPDDSSYKDIYIRSSVIQKLKSFHQMRKDQLYYGTDYVIKHVESYGSGITYTDYCIMASKAKKI